MTKPVLAKGLDLFLEVKLTFHHDYLFIILVFTLKLVFLEIDGYKHITTLFGQIILMLKIITFFLNHIFCI